MPNSRPFGLGMICFNLVALILLLVMVAGAFAPIVHCRSCEIEIAVREGEVTNPREPPPPHLCSHCNGRGRVTLLKMWLTPCEFERIQ